METLLELIGNRDFDAFANEWNARKGEFETEEKQELIAQTLAFQYDDKEFPFFLKVFDLVIGEGLDLNFNVEHWAPSLLCLSVHLVSRDLFDYLRSKGADVNFVCDKYAFEDEDYVKNELKVTDERYTTCLEFAEMKLEGLFTTEYHYQRPDWSGVDAPWAEVPSEEEITVSKRYYAYLVEQSQYLHDLIHLNQLVEHIRRIGGKTARQL